MRTRASASSPDVDTLGRYAVLCQLGSGGMASVYLARVSAAHGFERLFAIKRCHPHLATDRSFAAMFLDEARLAARIHHPNVVGTVDLGTEKDLYLVMDYVEGDSLAALMGAAGHTPLRRIPTDIAVRIMLDALAGLHAAHELRGAQGQLLEVVHRDVSHQNILVGVDGLSRISDFGIARARARLAETTGIGLKGKISYMSPEQVLGEAIDRRSDVFSAGVVFWELLTGRKLFVGDAPGAVTYALLNATIPAPSAVDFNLPRALDAVVARALERDVDRRFESALAFAEAIERAQVPMAPARAVGAYVLELGAAKLERIRSAVSASSTTSAGLLRRGARARGRRGRNLFIGGLALAGLFVAAGLVRVLVGPTVEEPASSASRAGPGPRAGGKKSATLALVEGGPAAEIERDSTRSASTEPRHRPADAAPEDAGRSAPGRAVKGLRVEPPPRRTVRRPRERRRRRRPGDAPPRRRDHALRPENSQEEYHPDRI